MAADGPTQADLTGTRITDDAGNQYKLQQKLGKGATAAVYQGVVVDAKSGGNKVGETVAIKIPSVTSDPDALENAKREEAVLAKVGDLKGLASPKGDSQTGSTLIQDFIPGQMVTDFMYKNEKGKNDIVRRDMSQSEKADISYGLLREYAALQMLNIIHCDMKPDNMMYDPQTSTLKLMDFGNAVDQTKEYRHEYIQGAGTHYLPDEAMPNRALGLEGTGNTTKTDLYSVGVIIASLYSDQCYMAERDKRSAEEYAPQQIMDDVLGPDVAAKEGMPADLFAITRHLTQVNPENRPENIALANGVSNSAVLSDVHATQLQADQIRQGCMAKADAMKVPQAVKDILTSHRDLSTLRNELATLEKNPELDAASKGFIKTTLPIIDDFTRTQAKKLQAGRAQEVHNAYQAENITNAESTVNIVKELETLAAAHREKSFGGIVSFSKQYDSVGKAIMHSVNELKNDRDYPKIEPEKMKGTLEKLSGSIVESAARRLEKEQGTMQKLQALRDGLPDKPQQAMRNRH